MTIEIFKNWINVLIKPKEVFAQEKGNASLGKAIKIILIAGLIAGTFHLVASFILFDVFSSYSMGIIFAPIWLLITSGIYYIFAKLLKGKGNFTTQTYLTALVSAPCMLISAAISIFPFIGAIIIFPVFIELYLLTLALREVHQYSAARAILSWLIPMLIIIIVVIIVLVVVFMSIISYRNPNI